MGSIAQKLQNIIDSKAAISAAIEAKGGTVPTELTGYGPAIEALPSGGSDFVVGLLEKTLTAITSSDINGVRSLGDSAFANFNSLRSVECPPTLVSMRTGVFQNDSNLTSVLLNEGLQSIPNDTFRSCSNLKTLSIPSTVTSIGNYAFNGSGISSLTVPGNCQTVGTYIFYQTQSIKDITFEEGVRSIGMYAFAKTNNLSSVTFPSTLTSIGDHAFNDAKGIYGEVVLPDNITYLGPHFFSGAGNISAIHLPNSLTAMGEFCLNYNLVMSSLTFPSSLQTIGKHGCADQRALNTTLVMPPALTSIAAEVFTGNSLVPAYDFSQHTVVPTLASTNVFNNNKSDFKIIVPDDLYDSWTTASNWNYWASHIVKVSEYTP